jgi:hypothetical protein
MGCVLSWNIKLCRCRVLARLLLQYLLHHGSRPLILTPNVVYPTADHDPNVV